MGALANLELEHTPIIIGAGVIKEEAQINKIALEDSLAGVVLGSYSDTATNGNDRDGRLNLEYWDSETQTYYNSIALRNCGREAASKFLPSAIDAMHDNGQLAFVSVVALRGEDPYKVIPKLTEWALEMGADGVEINGSCQNEDPEHQILAQDPEASGYLAEEIRAEVGDDPIIGYKVPPLSNEMIQQFGRVRPKFDYYTVFNTLGNQQSPMNPATGRPYIEVNKGLAGVSGPSVRDLARENLTWWRIEMAGTDTDFISLGGVSGGKEVHYREEVLGAVLVGGVQAFRRARNIRLEVQRWAYEYVEAAYR